jgi:CRP/FNR family transcriptional regulator
MHRHELKLWHIRRHQLFANLPGEVVAEVDRISVMREYPPKTTLLAQERRVVYLIKEGYMELVTRDFSGREVILELLGPDDFFGLLEGDRSPIPFLRTLKPSRLCAISQEDFLGLLQRHPLMALRVFERQSERIQELEGRLESLVKDCTRKRIGRLLATLGEKFGPEGIPLSHQEIASMVGCARVTASTILSEFQRLGWIRTGRGKIRVVDRDALLALVC